MNIRAATFWVVAILLGIFGVQPVWGQNDPLAPLGKDNSVNNVFLPAPRDQTQALARSRKAIAEERFTRWIGAVNSGDPHSADNEQIDADLAREYANNHIQPKRTPLGARERREAMDELLLYAGAVSSSNPHAADNEEIDADLA